LAARDRARRRGWEALILWPWLIAAVSAAAEPTLPTLAAAVPPVYPVEALAAGLEAVVVLDLAIDETGRVVDAAVATSAGGPYAAAFDAAALAAVRSFQFEPGRDPQGRPAAARIGYALRFVPTQAAALSVEGVVRIAGGPDRLPNAQIRLEGPDGLTREGRTDRDGSWRFAGLQDGLWTVTVAAPGYEPQSAPVEIQAGKVANVTLYAVEGRPWETERADLEIEVLSAKPAPEVTERVLSTEEIRYLPGTNGDVVKVVQNLPGVSRPPLGTGQLLIRGTAPEDSSYFIDGLEIPIVFHFAGFSTVVNGDALQEVSLLPGNYSARYGRQLGGVVDLRTRRMLPAASRRYVSVDLFQTTAYVEEKIGERTALTFSGRRSYIDTIANPVFQAVGLDNVRAPRYYDGQLRVFHALPSGGSVTGLLFGSNDAFKILGEEEGVVDFGLGISFLKGQVEWEQPLAGGWVVDTTVIAGPEAQTFVIGADSEAYEKPFNCGLRSELRNPAGDGEIGWRLGVDLAGGRYRYLYDVAGFPDPPEQGNLAYLSPAAYLEPTFDTGPFSFTPGLRADGYWVDYNLFKSSLDPRVSARYEVSPAVTLKAGAGQYSQLPQFRQLSGAVGNPDLTLPNSLQMSVGADWQVTTPVRFELTAFYNALRSLVVGREDAFAFFTGPPPSGPLDAGAYANEGSGRSLGVELLAKAQTDRTVGWVATTLQRSERVNRLGERSLFSYDQPVVFTALVSHELPKRWRVGSRLRVGSGNPYTPVVNRVYDLDSRAYFPVYGEEDSERLPVFYQLDARFDKDWVFKRWTLTFYLDLQNATSRQNVEVMSWTDDFSAEAPISGLPIIPAFGLRGEW
jgi:TonB family protein